MRGVAGSDRQRSTQAAGCTARRARRSRGTRPLCQVKISPSSGCWAKMRAPGRADPPRCHRLAGDLSGHSRLLSGGRGVPPTTLLDHLAVGSTARQGSRAPGAPTDGPAAPAAAPQTSFTTSRWSRHSTWPIWIRTRRTRPTPTRPTLVRSSRPRTARSATDRANRACSRPPAPRRVRRTCAQWLTPSRRPAQASEPRATVTLSSARASPRECYWSARHNEVA